MHLVKERTGHGMGSEFHRNNTRTSEWPNSSCKCHKTDTGTTATLSFESAATGDTPSPRLDTALQKFLPGITRGIFFIFESKTRCKRDV